MYTAVWSPLLLILLTRCLTSTTSIEFATNDDISGAVMDFGLRLQNVMMQSYNGSNIVLSPTSIYGTLALSLLGSAGGTYNELVQTLKFSDVNTADHYRHLLLSEKLKHLNAARNSSQTYFGNGVFVDESLNLRDTYKECLVNVYNASVKYCNFNEGALCKEEINKWISSKTDNKIKELLKEPLPHNTQIVLTSAIYFQGQWLKPFLPEHTKKMKFSPDVHDNNKDVEVDMMLNFGKYKYSVSVLNDCELLAIPYNDTKTTLYILKPINPIRKSIHELLGEMTTTRLTSMIEDSTFRNVILRFPKMEAASRWDLKEALRFLGLNSMFSPQEANFALMVDTTDKRNHKDMSPFHPRKTNDLNFHQALSLPNPKVFIDAVLHEVKISFDEFGTEAVAATATTMLRTAVTFYLNSPFAFFIINEDTKLVTFSAVIFDPTK